MRPFPLAPVADISSRSAFYKEMREKYDPEPENLLTSHEPWPEVEGGCALCLIRMRRLCRSADLACSLASPATRHLVQALRGVGDPRRRVRPYSQLLPTCKGPPTDSFATRTASLSLRCIRRPVPFLASAAARSAFRASSGCAMTKASKTRRRPRIWRACITCRARLRSRPRACGL